MNRIELQVNKTPLIFTGKSVTYENKEFFYSGMESIKHINNDTPALMFTYEGQSVQIPYDPGDKSIMEQIFKEITAVSKSAKEPPLSPSQEELDALFAGLQPPPQTPPIPTPQPQPRPQQQHDYKHAKSTMEYSKTKTCSTCGKQIAKSAKRCPHCGAKNKKPIFKRWWFITIIIIVLLAIFSSIFSSSEKKNTTYLPVKAIDVMQAYNANEVSADKVYKNKYIEMKGTVDSIGNDIVDETYITLKGSNDEWEITSVQCYFSDENQIKKLASLKKGDKVTVKGKCTGLSLNVLVEDCELVK